MEKILKVIRDEKILDEAIKAPGGATFKMVPTVHLCSLTHYDECGKEHEINIGTTWGQDALVITFEEKTFMIDFVTVVTEIMHNKDKYFSLPLDPKYVPKPTKEDPFKGV